MSRRINEAMKDLRRRVAALDAQLQTVEVVITDGTPGKYGEDALVITLSPHGLVEQPPLCTGLWDPVPDEHRPVACPSEDPEITARRRLGLLN